MSNLELGETNTDYTIALTIEFQRLNLIRANLGIPTVEPDISFNTDTSTPHQSAITHATGLSPGVTSVDIEFLVPKTHLVNSTFQLLQTTASTVARQLLTSIAQSFFLLGRHAYNIEHHSIAQKRLQESVDIATQLEKVLEASQFKIRWLGEAHMYLALSNPGRVSVDRLVTASYLAEENRDVMTLVKSKVHHVNEVRRDLDLAIELCHQILQITAKTLRYTKNRSKSRLPSSWNLTLQSRHRKEFLMMRATACHYLGTFYLKKEMSSTAVAPPSLTVAPPTAVGGATRSHPHGTAEKFLRKSLHIKRMSCSQSESDETVFSTKLQLAIVLTSAFPVSPEHTTEVKTLLANSEKFTQKYAREIHWVEDKIKPTPTRWSKISTWVFKRWTTKTLY